MLATVADATLPDSAPAAMKTGAPLPGDARGGTEPAEAPAPEAAQPEQPAAAADQPADAAASHEKTADAEATEEAPEQPEEQQPELEGADALPGLMDTGRKHFTLQNWEGAVQVFGKAAEIASSAFGPFALECAEPMVWYGKALIRNAVAQAGLVDTKNADKKQGALEPEAGPASRFVFLDDDEDEEDEDDDAENADDQQTGEPADSENQQAVPQTAEGEQEIETDETDDDFTLAWEALSVAAKIYESESSEESKRKLADVYMLMGDCCLEDDNSTQAIDTFKKALELKESYLEETNRELAEVHHLLGLAFEHDNLIDDAVAQVGKAKTVLQKRIDLLKNSTTASDAKGKGKASETQDKADEEIAELESLIVEIDAKIDDLQNLAAQQAEGDAEAKRESTVSAAAAGAPANDISNLVVKKKRRAEDAGENAAETDAKRAKTDAAGSAK